MTLPNRIRAAWRAFVLGQAIESGALSFGTDPSAYSPAEYGSYIATSNGVYTCATLRASLLKSLPLRLYRVRTDGGKKEVTGGQLWELMHKVNPYWTFKRLLEMTELSLCLWGSAFWFLERGEGGRIAPREIWWGRPDRVRVFPHATDYLAGFEYLAPDGHTIWFNPGEVVWIRYPNPLDEFAGLSPLVAARLSADVASAAMKSNRNMFANGLQMGGAVFPKAGQTLTKEQATEIEESLSRRFKGVDKAHRWGVFRFEAEMKQIGFTPKDAEFLGALAASLEDIARAYKVPLDLVGGQRTYENVNAAHRAMWTHCLIPEAQFIADELTEQLLPLFGGQADLAEFDSKDVEVLHENENDVWGRAQGKIQLGAITVNEWREEEGLVKLPWGDAWWASMGLSPITSAEPPPKPEPAQPEPPAEEAAPEEDGRSHRRAIEFGSPDHERIWRRWLRRTAKSEAELSGVVVGLFKRQEESVLAKLGVRGVRAGFEEEPFDMAEWVRKFRDETKPKIAAIVEEMAEEAWEELNIPGAISMANPAIIRFIEQRAQRFAELVNETTWERLRASLAQGVDAGEGIPALAARVKAVMGDRIRSTPETIARTEVIGASNGGILEAWRQSGVVAGKVWLAALDERTRETHAAAHGQEVGLEEEFEVGSGNGPAPGQIGLAEEDCNCRCTMTAVIR